MYRPRFLQVSTRWNEGSRWKALDEIYKIYKRLRLCTLGFQSENQERRFWQASSGRSTQRRRRNHQTTAMQRSAFKNYAKFLQMFCIFAGYLKMYSQFLFIFCNTGPKFANQFLLDFCGNSVLVISSNY